MKQKIKNLIHKAAFNAHERGDFPVAEYAASHTLAIPIYPELSDDQQCYVVEKIKEFVTL